MQSNFPILMNQSRRSNRPIRVRMMILDPRNQVLCLHYANYRNRSRTSELFQRTWTPDEVRAELVATTIKTITLNNSVNAVNCELRFRNFLSQFRYDASNTQITVTQEDPQEPAFQYLRGSRFFEYYRRESRLIWDQSGLFDLDKFAQTNFDNERVIFDFIKIFLDDTTSAEALSPKVASILRCDRSPYA